MRRSRATSTSPRKPSRTMSPPSSESSRWSAGRKRPPTSPSTETRSAKGRPFDTAPACRDLPQSHLSALGAPTPTHDAEVMHPSVLLLSAFITSGATADVTSSLDLHLATDSTGLQAQLTTNVREGMHATVNWDAAGVTGSALVTVGPASLTLNKTDGQPLRIDVAGLSVVSPFPLGERPGQHQLMAASAPLMMAASAPFAAPSVGVLENLGSFSSGVLDEIVRWVRTVVPFLLLGLLLILLLPTLGGGVRGTAMRPPWERLGVGLLALIAMPSASIALLVGGVFLGVWWLGLMMVGLCAIALAAGYTYSGMVVGRVLFDRLGWTSLNIFWALLGGLALISVLTLIPYVGAFVALASVTYGMGALLLAPRTPAATSHPPRWLRNVHLPALPARRPPAFPEVPRG